jgi:hypothetical protein
MIENDKNPEEENFDDLLEMLNSFDGDSPTDYDKFMEKYKDDEIIKDIYFFGVSRIEEVFELVFE